jgi:3-dehydroquinate dehydratase-2
MRVLVLNGPNLNLLGTREPEVYGSTTLGDLERLIQGWGSDLGIETSFLQTNHEGEIVDAIHGGKDLDAILINPGALTHTSRAIGDAIGSVGLTAVEVHISNIKQREPWRAQSLVAAACVRSIYGRGVGGYQDALRHLRNRAAMDLETVRYGPHQDNVGDLRSPTVREAIGVVTLVHGGLWRQEYERDTTETLAVDLTEAGFVTWNIEYRRTGDGGGWPGSAHDVLTAFDHVSRDETLRSLPIFLLGHSAGGHLGLWAGGRRAEEVGLVVGLAPVTDLSAMAASDAVGAGEARGLLDSGAPPRSGPVAGKTLLVHGEDDEIVPVSHSTRLAGEARVEVIPGMGHFPLLDPKREHWQLVVEELGKIAGGQF